MYILGFNVFNYYVTFEFKKRLFLLIKIKHTLGKDPIKNMTKNYIAICTVTQLLTDCQ